MYFKTLVALFFVVCCKAEQIKYPIPAFNNEILPCKCSPGFYGDACQHIEEGYDFIIL